MALNTVTWQKILADLVEIEVVVNDEIEDKEVDDAD